MKVILGATGNIGSVIANTLLAKGEKVRVVGRDASRLQTFVQKGAEAFAADVTDFAALSKAFHGARAVFALIPPDPAHPDYLEKQRRGTDTIASALESTGASHVVALSSMGADKPSGTGPVTGLHYFEEKLNNIAKLNALHLRAGYFMENTLGQIGAIQNFGMVGTALPADLKLPMIATRDIGAFAANALSKLDFQGKQPVELLGQRDLSYAEVTKIIGKATGRPELTYVQLPPEQFKSALLQSGMSANVADLILEMCAALISAHMVSLEPRSARNATPTSFEQFVQEVFVPAYRGIAAKA
ncbi:MAG TPA: NmrA family NAD(P)-binding protein [Candidatus Dormibacteraeota bacterium]|nr:NmrA family NAD(P)-binding protein [Candidatus Dormibacteraeota bacterium]